MRRLITLFPVLFFFLAPALAQPPAPCTNGTQNTCKCSTSPILCSIEDLDGYTYSMTTYLHPTDGPYKSGGGTQYMCPGSNGTTSHNPTWFRFPATARPVSWVTPDSLVRGQRSTQWQRPLPIASCGRVHGKATPNSRAVLCSCAQVASSISTPLLSRSCDRMCSNSPG